MRWSYVVKMCLSTCLTHYDFARCSFQKTRPVLCTNCSVGDAHSCFFYITLVLCFLLLLAQESRAGADGLWQTLAQVTVFPGKALLPDAKCSAGTVQLFPSLYQCMNSSFCCTLYCNKSSPTSACADEIYEYFPQGTQRKWHMLSSDSVKIFSLLWLSVWLLHLLQLYLDSATSCLFSFLLLTVSLQLSLEVDLSQLVIISLQTVFFKIFVSPCTNSRMSWCIKGHCDPMKRIHISRTTQFNTNV